MKVVAIVRSRIENFMWFSKIPQWQEDVARKQGGGGGVKLIPLAQRTEQIGPAGARGASEMAKLRIVLGRYAR
jgi:hypothetical protein